MEKNAHAVANKQTSLLSGCLMMFCVSGSIAIPMAQHDIMKQLNMSLSQYGFAATLYLLGTDLTAVSGPFIDKFGCKMTIIFGLILTIIGHLSVFLVLILSPFPGDVLLFYITLLITGFSLSFMWTVALWTNMLNFSCNAHGRISGLLFSFLFGGAAIFGLLYRMAFSPHIAYYFLTVGACCTLGNVFALIFARRLDTPRPEYESIENSTKPDEHQTADYVPFASFQMILLLTLEIIVFAVTHACLYMYPIYLSKADYEPYITSLGNSVHVLTVIMMLLMGCLSDRYINSLPRMTFYLFGNIFNFIVFVLAVFLLHELPLLIILVVTLAVGFVNSDSLILTEMHNLVGTNGFGKGIGAIYFLSVIATVLLEYVLTSFYDVTYVSIMNNNNNGNNSSNSDQDVVMPKGLTNGIIVVAGLMGLSVLFNILYILLYSNFGMKISQKRIGLNVLR